VPRGVPPHEKAGRSPPPPHPWLGATNGKKANARALVITRAGDPSVAYFQPKYGSASGFFHAALRSPFATLLMLRSVFLTVARLGQALPLRREIQRSTKITIQITAEIHLVAHLPITY